MGYKGRTSAIEIILPSVDHLPGAMSFDYMVSMFYDNNMTNEEFEEMKKEMSEDLSDIFEDGQKD